MNPRKTLSEYVSELNKVFNKILENPKTQKNWEYLQIQLNELREDGYDVLLSPLSEITVDDPDFFTQTEISDLCKKIYEAREKKILEVKHQNFEKAADERDKEKLFGKKLLELYKNHKGKEFNHFIKAGNKMIIYISTLSNSIENVIQNLL